MVTRFGISLTSITILIHKEYKNSILAVIYLNKQVSKPD